MRSVPEHPESKPGLEVSSEPAVSESKKFSDFERATQQQAPNVIFEFTDFLRHNKKWWLTPIILVLLVFSVFIALTSSAIAPFIYVLF